MLVVTQSLFSFLIFYVPKTNSLQNKERRSKCDRTYLSQYNSKQKLIPHVKFRQCFSSAETKQTKQISSRPEKYKKKKKKKKIDKRN